MKFNKLYLCVLLIGLSIKVFGQYKVVEQVKKVDSLSETEIALAVSTEDNFDTARMLNRFKASYPELPSSNIIRVLPYVSANLVEDGPKAARVKTIAKKLLTYLNLDQRIRVLYFTYDLPVAAFSYPAALQVASSVESILTDDELLAVCAHEVSHLVVQEAYKAAIDQNNTKAIRAVELICDMMAIAILTEMKVDPANLVNGLAKMQTYLSQVMNQPEDEDGDHLTIKQRRKFVNLVVERFNSSSKVASEN